MTDNDDTDDKQVSVAELLARNGQRVSAPGGRRRRGASGGISVAELTGEIPIITDERSHYLAESADEAPVEVRPVEESPVEVLPVEKPPVEKPPVEKPPVEKPPVEKPPAEAKSHTDDRSDGGFSRGDFTRGSDSDPDRFVGTFYEEDAPKVDDDSDEDSGFVPSWPSFAGRTTQDDRDFGDTEEEERAADKREAEERASEKTTVLKAVVTPVDDELDSDSGPEDDVEVADEEKVTDTPPVTNMPGSKRSPVRQWLGILGQGVVAIVLGALLFKGFERLWDVLPWVALVLAFFVIVGLVAVVRVLRRTDDIVSILLAVLVGGFVTLGPLAFMLSTS